MARGVNRGEIWLYTFKPPKKRRPVVVLTRPEVITFLDTVMVAPITSTVRGERFQSVPIDGTNQSSKSGAAFLLVEHLSTIGK